MQPGAALDTFLTRHRLEEKSILVGFSGGVDSTVLLHLLAGLRRRRNIRLRALHVNHGLRGNESDRDARFCRETCRRLDVGFECVSAEVKRIARGKRMSIESAARNIRRRVLLNGARKHGIRHLFLAHTADDQVETILMRLGRGTGLFGMTGMDEAACVEDVFLCRPLLGVSKADLIRTARQAGIAWREDASNLENDYTRNRVRNRAIPELEAAFGKALRPAVLRFGEIGRELLDEYHRLLDRTYPGGFSSFPNRVLIDLERIRGIGPAGFTELFRDALRRSALAGDLPGRDACLRVFGLACRESGKRTVPFPGVIAERDRGFLHVHRQGDRGENQFRPKVFFRKELGALSLPFGEADPAFYRSVARGERSVWRYAFKEALQTDRFALGALKDFPVPADTRLAGRSLKKRFADKRVPRWLSGALPVLFYGEKPILVPGVCGDPEYVGDRGSVVEFEFHPSCSDRRDGGEGGP